MQDIQLKNIVEAALLAAGRPLNVDELAGLFGIEAPERREIIAAIEQLRADYENRGIMIVEVASGYRVQTRAQVTEWVSRLWEERPQRYSRALLETLALIAYRQPITRGEIEDIRGVAVSTNIIRTLSERGWIRVVGHRDVPGKPAMYATTREFLDYFGLKRLDELPTLAELRDLDTLELELDLRPPEQSTGPTVRSASIAAAPEAEGGIEASAPDAPGALPADVIDDADVPSGVEELTEKRDGDGGPSALSRSAPVVPLKQPGSA